MRKISITEFMFVPLSHGAYRVFYSEPKRGTTYSARIEDMTLIDRTKNEVHPKQKDLAELRRAIKHISKEE